MQTVITALQLKKYAGLYALVMLVSLVLAAQFPMMHDETYYIAFSHRLQSSYVDHPPFVALLTIIQSQLGLHHPIYERAWVVILHLMSTGFLMAIVYNHCAQEDAVSKKLMLTFLISYVVPVFGFFSFFIMPDTGLILALSLMLWAADKSYHLGALTWNRVGILGCGLGIGLLSKLHAVPLGGGLVIGLLCDFRLRSKLNVLCGLQLLAILLLGVLVASPMLKWNLDNHFASFLFQLQHGFGSKHWHLLGGVVFILGSIGYLTPWFFFRSLHQSFASKQFFIIIPVCGLGLILLWSSLLNHVLPNWLSPAFWLLIPSAVIYADQDRLTRLLRHCMLTALIWVPLLTALLLPSDKWNLKQFIELVHGNKPRSWITLFWEELPSLIQRDATFTAFIQQQLSQQPQPLCTEPRPIVGTLSRVWAAQLEYHSWFSGAKILNLEQNSANFYLWRDKWSDYAHCNILIVSDGNSDLATVLAPILTLEQQIEAPPLVDYPKVRLQIASGVLKDPLSIDAFQRTLVGHPHY